MSHKKLRGEKNCLNCGQIVEERFCPVCGQENLELQDSAFHLIIHYFQDLFHYDGKFWYTIKHFFRKPGLVQEDFMAGKRQRHLKPIQFYVFASTVFFFIFFFLVDPSTNVAETKADNVDKRLYHLKQEKEFRSGSPDTLLVDSLMAGLKGSSLDTVEKLSDLTASDDVRWDLFDDNPDAEKDSTWLGRFFEDRIKKKTEELNRIHQGDDKSALKAFLTELLHTLPQLIFFSLPFFALFLQLLYFRSGQKRYVANFIFSIYHYSYLYVILLVYLLVRWLLDIVPWENLEALWGWMTLAFVLYVFVYLYLSMRRFYKDKGFSLVLRYMALLFFMFCTLLVLFVVTSFLTFII